MRNSAGKLLGISIARLEPSEASELLRQLKSTFEASTAKFEERCGALMGAGYMLAQCATGAPILLLPAEMVHG